jgi:PAS domain S-box-containing protein
MEMDDRYDENTELAILKGSVENTNEAFVTIDENHRVLFFNRAAEKIFGYSQDEVLGNDLDIIIAPGCSMNHRFAVKRFIETREPKLIGHATEILATRKDGELFPAEISFSVADINGKLYFTGIVRDMTDTKALLEQISRTERLAALGQFVAEITHEIKNPLMIIGGFASQVVKHTRDKKSLSKLNVIMEEVERLENLLKELREYYLPRNLSSDKIEINNMLRDVYSLIKNDCRKKGIQTDLIAEGQIFIGGDKDKLKQVLLNLLNNSIDATEEEGNLSVRSKLIDGNIEITIKDDGCGISEEDEEKIFSPFFTTKSHGTGLGLSISRSIVEAHKGNLLYSRGEGGKGALFKIILPVYNGA